MRKVKRWEPEFVEFLQTFNMRPNEDGDFVLFQHYEQLQKTNQELLEALENLSRAVNPLNPKSWFEIGEIRVVTQNVIDNAKQVMGDSDE